MALPQLPAVAQESYTIIRGDANMRRHIWTACPSFFLVLTNENFWHPLLSKGHRFVQISLIGILLILPFLCTVVVYLPYYSYYFMPAFMD
jgi:tryptophan-rich sensory protein